MVKLVLSHFQNRYSGQIEIHQYKYNANNTNNIVSTKRHGAKSQSWGLWIQHFMFWILGSRVKKMGPASQKYFQYFYFLAVQDSSIGDLVTQ